MVRVTRCVLRLVLLCTVLTPIATAQSPGATPAPTPPVADRHAAAESLDIKAAVDAYLAKMPPAQRARSNAYFEGGYWLLLIDFIYALLVMRLLLRLRSSAKMRNFAGRITRSRFLQPAAYWIQFIVVVALLTFPLTVYEAYYREHKYGLLNQTFGPWLREQSIMLAVNLVL